MKTAHDSETAAHGQQVITACAFIHHKFEVSQSGGLAPVCVQRTGRQEVACDFDARKNRYNLNSTCKVVEKVFLPKRAATKKFLPGVYELPGGHIDFGEDIVTGLKREIREEFGMEVEVGDTFGAYTYKNEIKGSHSIEVIYFARFVDPIEQIKLDPEDHSTYEWFSHEDVIARKDEIIAEEFADHESGSDPEYLLILKGFELLAGGKINF